MKNTFQGVVVNLKPMIRNAIMEGKKWMVVPTVMITEGVHAGSGGPLYYPKEELAKTPAVWNHKPIVIYHPTENGRAVSACEPAVISKRKVGVIMNTQYAKGSKKGEPGKLICESWFDPERLKDVDERVYNALQNGEMVEVSTGLFTDNEHESGEWNGETYDSIARNYRPDHLAILPDQKGACSIEDGAGLLRNSRYSYTEISQRLNDMVRAKQPQGAMGVVDAWVCDVFDGFAIYNSKGKMFKQGYSVDDKGAIKLVGAPVEVVRRTTYTDLDGTVLNTRGVNTMTKKQMIDALIENGAFDEGDRDVLTKKSTTRLRSLLTENQINYVDSGSDDNSEEVKDAASQVKPKKFSDSKNKKSNNAEVDEDEEEEDDEEDEEEDDKKPFPPKRNAALVSNRGRHNRLPLTLNQYIEDAPPAIREVLQAGMRTLNSQRRECVEVILANERNRFTREQLMRKPVEELEALADLAAEPETAPATNNYFGQGEVGPLVENEDEEEGLALPVLNFSVRKDND